MKAFPSKEPIYGDNVVGVKENSGMDLRDYFAAKALQGLLSNPKLQEQILEQGGCHSGWIEDSAWAFADEMMKARDK
jgi:hypothetical protein